MRINRAVQKLLSEVNLSQADMAYQEACTQLLGWIQEHPELAKDAFPNYCREEDQMKLLTPGAAVNLQRKAKNLDRLYEELGTEDPEELVRMVKRAKEMDSFDFTGDIWTDDELDEFSGEERENAFREIGLAGEEYAYMAVLDHFLSKGYMVRSEEEKGVLLSVTDTQQTDRKVEILRPDTESYHQPGWDIRVSLFGDAGGTADNYYLEVKTHTSKSVSRGMLSLSNEQMKLAAEQREHYILLSVVYDYRNKTVLGMDVYSDLIQCLGEGSICHAEGKYLLRCQGAGVL